MKKTKLTALNCPETEAYYQRKNKRAEWWKKNWSEVVFGPPFILVCIGGATLILWALCGLIYWAGLKFYETNFSPLDKHLQEIQLENKIREIVKERVTDEISYQRSIKQEPVKDYTIPIPTLPWTNYGIFTNYIKGDIIFTNSYFK